MIEAGVGCAASGIIVSTILLTGMGFKLSALLVSLAHENMAALLALGAVTSFVLGLGLDSIPCYIILVMMVGPALIKAGIVPIAAHLFFFYFGVLAYITPPVAVAAYFAASLAGADMWRTGWMACRLGIVSYLVPFIFVYNPALLMIGSPVEVGMALVTSIPGAILLAYGVQGWFLSPLNWLLRIVTLAAAVLLIIPGWMTDITGAALAAVVVLWQWRISRRLRARTS